MSGIFSKPKMPEVQPISYTPTKVEPPVTETEDIEKIKDEEKKKQKTKKKGTILTGPQGILTPADVSYKSLLGE